MLDKYYITMNVYLTSEESGDLNSKLDEIMATVKSSNREILDKLNSLQETVDTEQEQIRQAIGGLEEVVAQLRADLAEAGTAEERAEIADKIDAITADLKSTIADESTEPEVPETPEDQA